MSKKKILILGGSGFIGQNLFVNLKKKYIVHKFGNKREKSQIINLKNLKNLKYNFDLIINCAGDSVVKNSYNTNLNNDYKIVLDVIKYITKYKPETKLFQISSASVYGNSISSLKLKPISPYSKRKLSCENLLKKFSKKKKINYKILRFFSVYGNGIRKQLFWETCKKIRKKDYIFQGTGQEIRSWMHIDDLSKIIVKVIETKNNNKKIYNFCGKQIIKNKNLLSIFFKLYGLRFQPVFNMIKNKGNPDFMFTKKCDLKKINYKQKVKLVDGIKKYIKWEKKSI